MAGRKSRRRQVSEAPAHAAGHSEFIDELGGPSAVAAIIQPCIGRLVHPQAISNWRRRGVPYRYRIHLALVAQARGIGTPDGFLGGTQPPAVQQDSGAA